MSTAADNNITGDLILTDDLTVGGAMTVTGATTFNGGATITGNQTISGNMTVAGTESQLVNVIGTGTTEGGVKTVVQKVKSIAAIPDNTATLVLTVTIPNVTARASIFVRFQTGFDAAPINDSVRSGMFLVNVTRRAGVAAVASIIPFEMSATNAVTNVNQLVISQIATLAAGATLTTAHLNTAITGGATVTETFTVTVTNVASTGTPTTSWMGFIEVINDLAGGVTVA